MGNKTPKNRLHQPWTAKEEQYLKENYPIKTAKEIAPILGRSICAIHHKARSMDIVKEIPKKKIPARSSHMAKVLTPAQCRVMRRFLGALLRAHDMNPNLNVGEFIIAYRKYIAGREEILNDVI